MEIKTSILSVKIKKGFVCSKVVISCLFYICVCNVLTNKYNLKIHQDIDICGVWDSHKIKQKTIKV